jgi:hypothetical protein
MHGWDSAVDSILASGEYNDNFGDDAVPGGGCPGCDPQMPSQSPSQDPSNILVENNSIVESYKGGYLIPIKLLGGGSVICIPIPSRTW